MVVYLTLEQILVIHKNSIDIKGGSHGIRDHGLIESAVAAPCAGWEGQDFYASLEAKAAALGFSLIQNHAFVDGNKRVGYGAMKIFLRLNGLQIRPTADEAEPIILKVADGKMDRAGLEDWIKSVVKPLQ